LHKTKKKREELAPNLSTCGAVKSEKGKVKSKKKKVKREK